ncbi:MAG: molybdopterin oxidoreductase family protein [Deltaproteobacteria bacterium]|nr:molybdopterin oxidoreductase family protein [Deltaproteobacteria bacterium]
MAHLPLPEAQLIAQYGPHLNYEPPGGWQAGGAPDRLVKTHCCFCGVQCGIQLKVRDEKVIGFEPWEEFPVNQGKLCPKGVKRYLQNNHPDRLLSPLIRTDSGFREASWDDALTVVINHIRRIQQTYGKDAFAVLSGASLTNEKTYLMGKFARVALGTANIDYNGRLCMVSAGAANKMAFGIDRAANPWSDIPLADCVLVTGSNIGECFPILTDHLWRARDNGATLIVIDPRMTPIARTADLFLPVRPGRDSALMNGILHVLIERDWIDHGFIAAHTIGFDAVCETVASYTPQRAAEITGVPATSIIRAAELWAEAENSMLLHARGIEHHTKGVENVLSCVNLVLATGRIGRPGCGYGTITGQGNGQGGREHGQRCNQLPGGRDIENPRHRQEIAQVWKVNEAEIPPMGLTAVELMDAVNRGVIKGLLTLSFNPLVSLPDAARTRAALEKLEFYVAIDVFMSETARYADVILSGSLHEEDEGTVTTGEGRVVRIRQAIRPPANARVDWEIIVEIAQRLGKERFFPYACSEDIFRELCRASAGGPVDYAGMTYHKIEQHNGVFWPCPSLNHPGTPRLFAGGIFAHPDGKARFHPVAYRPPAEDVDADYPIIMTSGRVVSQYLSGTQTRRIGPLVDQYPGPQVELHPQLAETLGVKTGDLVHVESRRGAVTLPALVVRTIRPDTIFIPYHWPGEQSANRLTNRALDPISKIPEFKVCAVRITRAEPGNSLPLNGGGQGWG